MSLRPDGHYRCDGCDTDVGNGSAQSATVVITTEPVEAGTTTHDVPVTLHFCHEPRPRFPRGCSGRAVSAANIAAYLAWKDSA